MRKDGSESSDSDKGDRQTEEHLRLPAVKVYKIVQIEGEGELKRSVASLWWSGIAAGIAISASLLAQGLLRYHLPETPYRPVLESFGYCVGFLIVILGRMQLFTENTVTVILPLLKQRSLAVLWKVARLWAVVFLANIVGALAIALANVHLGTVAPEYLAAMLEVAEHYKHMSASQALALGIPAGFFIAAIVWMLPSSEGSEFWVIVTLTYLIAVGGFTHVVAGSSEVFLMLVTGQIGPAHGILGVILPTLIGNVIGGTGLFALLAYGQVQEAV